MTMPRLVATARKALTVRRVFGDPYEVDGVTVIPAAVLRGGVGGGGAVAPGRRRQPDHRARGRRRDRVAHGGAPPDRPQPGMTARALPRSNRKH
jgi:uncharacterized spore protein YtfJ